MNLKHIDNSFYLLTEKEASRLCINRLMLPRHGYARILHPPTLEGVTLCHSDGRPNGCDPTKALMAQVMRTKVGGETVWALHLYFDPSLTNPT